MENDDVSIEDAVYIDGDAVSIEDHAVSTKDAVHKRRRCCIYRR
jgi:hypothetical protein